MCANWVINFGRGLVARGFGGFAGLAGFDNQGAYVGNSTIPHFQQRKTTENAQMKVLKKQYEEVGGKAYESFTGILCKETQILFGTNKCQIIGL